MADNLALTDGLISAEAAMMALAPHIGRHHAHEVVYAACRETAAGKGRLQDVLASNSTVKAHFSPAQVAGLLAPGSYLDSAGAMVDRAQPSYANPDRMSSHHAAQTLSHAAGVGCGVTGQRPDRLKKP